MFQNRPTLLPRGFKLFLSGSQVNVPFFSPHYQVHPNQLGENQAVKLSLRPCNDNYELLGSHKEIKHLVQEYLQTKDICMHLMIQKQTDPCIDRIDDFINEWIGPLKNMGTLRIPKGTQYLDESTCEDISFNPSHSLAENKPLGWLSRVRNIVYARSAKKRLTQNPPSNMNNNHGR